MKELRKLIDQAANGEFSHLRACIPLVPVQEKVMPPTYLSSDRRRVFAQEERIAGDKILSTVLVQSIAAGANSFESVLLNEAQAGHIPLPYLTIETQGIGDIQKNITSLELAHRTFDQFINKSTIQGQRFRDHKVGQRLIQSHPKNATPLFQYDPVSLLLGVWGQGFGLARLRFPRVLQAEVVAYNAVPGIKTSSKSDSFDIPRSTPIFTSDHDVTNDFRLAADPVFKSRKNPSDVTLGGIPPSVDQLGGITAFRYQQNIGFMLSQLRAYQFPTEQPATIERNRLARKVLIALGLLALVANAHDGFTFRSGCAFQIEAQPGPDGADHDLVLEFLGHTTRHNLVEYIDLTDDSLNDLRLVVCEAIKEAKKAGLPWNERGLMLEPDKELRAILGTTTVQKKAARKQEASLVTEA